VQTSTDARPNCGAPRKRSPRQQSSLPSASVELDGRWRAETPLSLGSWQPSSAAPILSARVQHSRAVVSRLSLSLLLVFALAVAGSAWLVQRYGAEEFAFYVARR